MTVNPIIKPIYNKLDGLEKNLEVALKKIESLEAVVPQNTVKLARLEEESGENREAINYNTKDVKALKNVISAQQKYLESLRRKDMANILTISGIPKGEMKVNEEAYGTVEEKVKCILTTIGCATYQYNILPAKEIDGRDTLFIKLKLKNNENAKTILSNAKRLKNFTAAKIYINKDEPFFSRKENNRLRKKKADLVTLYGNEAVKSEKGKLYHNGIMVDQFDLSNQIFRYARK